jgi:hypothetical protein
MNFAATCTRTALSARRAVLRGGGGAAFCENRHCVWGGVDQVRGASAGSDHGRREEEAVQVVRVDAVHRVNRLRACAAI